MGKRCDLTGQRFGKLTAVERTGDTQEGYFVWRCQCDCGQEVLVNSKRLMRGTVTDCGCVPKTNARNGRSAEDLTGRRFGKLTVLHRADNKNGRTHWVCQCDCGNLHTASAKDLKRGHCKSCGCLRSLMNGITDITDQKFGRLQALYPTEKRDRKGSVYWHCRCECGNEVDVTEDGLVHGNYRSCGCLQREIQKEIPNQLHLIDGTCIEWLECRKERSDNTSGFRGVYRQSNGKYRVAIGFKRKQYYVGTFRTFEEAVSARLEVEKLIHGGFLDAYYEWKEKKETEPFVFEVERDEAGFSIKRFVK